MNSQDILNVFLIVGILVITLCVIFVTYFFVLALKAVQNLADHLVSTTSDLKDKVGLKALAAVPPILVALIGRFLKRGR